MDLTPPQPLHHQATSEARDFFGQSNFLVCKLTDYCNLRCKYCHQDALNGKAVLMPIETFKNAVRLILKPSGAPIVNVQFHGGEPLLQPDEFFEEAVAFARAELESPTRKVRFYIQTNLTKVDERRQAMLKRLQIGISFSVDGPPHINDEMRGGGKIIFKNYARLKAAQADVGAICLIQPANWDRMDEVLSYFREADLRNVRFNMMVPDGRGEEVATATADKLYEARRTILDQMLALRDAACVDSTLYNQMKRFAKPNGAPSSFEYHGCEALYCQAGRSLYSINPDGTFYACDRIAERKPWSMGSVNESFDAPELHAAKKKRSAFHHKDEWWAKCEGCDAKKICEFSCSAYYVDKVDTRETECQQTKKMWNYMLKRKDEVLDFVKKHQSPLAVDADRALETQDETTWTIRDLAADSFYNELTDIETVAANRSYKLLKRGEQYFLWLHKREKVFEVDSMVAAIAKFNGSVPPELIERLLEEAFPPTKLKQTLNDMASIVPEVFMGVSA